MKSRIEIHVLRTDRALTVLVSLQPIKSWRCRALQMNVSCNWIDLLQVSSDQFSSCAVNNPCTMLLNVTHFFLSSKWPIVRPVLSQGTFTLHNNMRMSVIMERVELESNDPVHTSHGLTYPRVVWTNVYVLEIFSRIFNHAHCTRRFFPVLFAWQTFYRLTLHRPVQQQQQQQQQQRLRVSEDESRDCNASLWLDDDDSAWKMQ